MKYYQESGVKIFKKQSFGYRCCSFGICMIKKFIVKLRQILIVISSSSKIYPDRKYAFHRLSFSQDGEDIIIDELFANKTHGYYVDVGACHPQRFSNTYYYYLKGWKGLNIDAMPGGMKVFYDLRPRDINVEAAISDKNEILTYYQFEESALNTLSCVFAQRREKSCNLVAKSQIETVTLAMILDKHLQSGQHIDILNVDVEGLDYQVLRFNNWNKYKPTVILVEILETSLDVLFDSETFHFLIGEGYVLYAKTRRTCVFVDSSFLETLH
jgi:FkbM family methyltransferase